MARPKRQAAFLLKQVLEQIENYLTEVRSLIWKKYPLSDKGSSFEHVSVPGFQSTFSTPCDVTTCAACKHDWAQCKQYVRQVSTKRVKHLIQCK